MRSSRVLVMTGLLLLCICLPAAAQDRKPITVTGKLVRVMAIGGESTGWTIQLDSEITVDGKQASSIEVDYHKTAKLEKLENHRVRASGKLGHRHGVETGDRPVLVVSSIKQIKATVPPATAKTSTFSLSGSEWLLEDLGGSGVIDNAQATLIFAEAGRVAGNSSCNRFSGPVEVGGDSIKFGPLASTRMACPEAVMNQEAKYLKALQAAERFEWKDPFLLVYCQGLDKPLRFTRMAASKSAKP
jgi:heat shock protein HslJ